jgi:hypothetical protein
MNAVSSVDVVLVELEVSEGVQNVKTSSNTIDVFT